LNTIFSAVEKLRDPEYRRAFVAAQINVGIPFQIRALLKARGKTQDWLAKKTGMLQPRISGLMTPGKTHPNIQTLRRVADAFDCGLAVRFMPFTELTEWSERFDPETFKVPDFDTEMTLREDKAPTAATTVLQRAFEPGIALGNLANCTYWQSARLDAFASTQATETSFTHQLWQIPRKEPRMAVASAPHHPESWMTTTDVQMPIYGIAEGR
jgi:transcriptional regulator with XRE-family HTH domain